jgi:6-phosphogluconolactonase
MNPEVRILDTSEELAREAADLFVWLGEQAIREDRPFRVALSGGSTPRALHAALATTPFAGRLDWSKVEFFFGDERCVPPDHPESNYGMANETLFRPLKIAPERVFRMAGEADPEEAVRQYEEILRARLCPAGSAWPMFDLILLGLGEDAHTASLFPETAALEETRRLVVSNTAPQGIKHRITLTAPAINHARTILFLVSGSGKAKAVERVLHDQTANARQAPAKLIRPITGRLLWFLDRAAAASLPVTRQALTYDEE